MRIKRFAAILIICAAALFTLVWAACSQQDNVRSISVRGYDAENPPVVDMGNFDYGNYDLDVTYNTGKTEILTLTEDMVSESDKLKFYKDGSQTLSINLGGASCEFTVVVQRNSFSNLTLPDVTEVYTGKPVTVEISGDLPADAKVLYPNGNSFINAGVYDVTAVVYGDIYETTRLSSTITILRTDYDCSELKFEDKTFTYDKTAKSLQVEGELPVGVTVTYEIDGKQTSSVIDAGEYTVTAKFITNNGNYNPLPSMQAKLTIQKASYSIEATLSDLSAVYDGAEHALALKGNLPEGVEAVYTVKMVKNSAGEDVADTEKSGNSAVDAGVYEVKVSFNLHDPRNYEDAEPMSATLLIDRAEYDVSDVFLYSISVKYDGKEHTVKLQGRVPGSEAALPEGVEVTYTVKIVRDGDGNPVEGEIKEGNGAVEVGTYEVCASFTHSNANYNQIDGLSALLIVEENTPTEDERGAV
ncbi:MAG: MBG domain-containing protein [Candidatus Coproplasma sp.]